LIIWQEVYILFLLAMESPTGGNGFQSHEIAARNLIRRERETPVIRLTPEAREDALKVAKEVCKEGMRLLAGKWKVVRKDQEGYRLTIQEASSTVGHERLRHAESPKEFTDVFSAMQREPEGELAQPVPLSPTSEEYGSDLKIIRLKHEYRRSPKTWFRPVRYTQSIDYVFYPDTVIMETRNFTTGPSGEVLAPRGLALEKHEVYY
jgi:hypothetical protein